MAEYELRLFVLGNSPKSQAAIANLRRLCEQEIFGRYELEIIDVMKNPDLAEEEKILATPTLIKKAPLPEHRLIGDMSLTDKVMLGLGLGPHRGTVQKGVRG
jgi:circadian clock protein KaiB